MYVSVRNHESKNSEDKMRSRACRKSNAFLKFRCFCVLLLLIFGECSSEKPKDFISEHQAPKKQELRWSNGRKVKSFDPAKAASPPEIDIVRAIFKGLTDLDPQTLKAVPAIAISWSSSEDYSTWVFHLRRDAVWTNGERVTARDFVRSWQRIVDLNEKAPYRKLLKNIVGMDTEKVLPVFADKDEISTKKLLPEEKISSENKELNEAPSSSLRSNFFPNESKSIGIEAVDDSTLKVKLLFPDPNFPALVAHPVFYPVYNGGNEFEVDDLNPAITTNGAFRISSVGQDGVTLDKNEKYWNSAKVQLDRVKFVPFENEDQALMGYERGEFDVLTNANFSPVVLKMLQSYKDFSKTTHGAVNFYQFNLSQPPFNDKRVREAMIISIDRKAISENETGGITEPAYSFSPFGNQKLEENKKRAKELLQEAGFTEISNFPKIRLLINRNELQKRIARAVAKMWEKNLGIQTEIIIKEGKDFEAALVNGEFDLVRRGVVFPTANETSNMMLMFPAHMISTTIIDGDELQSMKGVISSKESPYWFSEEAITTEREAFEHLPAIPIYFPVAFALVKPYVKGFVLNSLDAPSLEKVWIDTNWKEKEKQ